MFDRVVLIGAGRTSRSIIERLARMAPVTIVDVSAASVEGAAELSEAADGTYPIVTRTGDGTSRLVLEDLRGDRRARVGLVVSPGDDRAALEVCRLGAELEYKPIVAIVHDRAAAEQCEKHGAATLVRAEVVGQLVAQSLQQEGFGTTSAIGSGRGEILEFSVLPSSPAAGVPIARLRADGWRVAMIYRRDELVLPTGTTALEADDRVVIVGDPKRLPLVAESLRVGRPTFPLLHGPNVVVYLPTGLDGTLETEAELVTHQTRAATFIRLYPGAATGRRAIEAKLADGSMSRKHVEDAPLEGPLLEAHVASLRAKEPGVVVARARDRSPLDVIFGRGGRDATLCNEVGVPVLFAKGDARYQRIVLCVTDGESGPIVADIALDLSRIFQIPLVILRVKLPSFLQPAEAATEKLIETIEHRARLHGLAPEVRVLEGNPIAEWVGKTLATDLVVISRRVSLRDSFSKPDLALHVARKAKGSVLVLTTEE